MNKKGFTLIELLAVIVVLGIIVLIAIPTIMGISKTIKDNMYNKKITFIEEAAVLYGQDDRKNISISTKKYQNNPCKIIKVKDLIPKYLDSDNDEENKRIIDPRDKDKYLDNLEIIIYLRNNSRVSSILKDSTHKCV